MIRRNVRHTTNVQEHDFETSIQLGDVAPEQKTVYKAVPTIKRFHECPAQVRCIVGPVGSGKTAGATMEVCYYLPMFLYKQYGIKYTKWVVIRNTYPELIDTTQRTVFDWFPWGNYQSQRKNYILEYPNGVKVELLFRSCDNKEDVKKFKSLEVTGYWIDESIEVHGDVKRMLKNRGGRFPKKCPVKFGIETTNPPDTEHETYTSFAWETPPPGPKPEGTPLKNHVGFWQPPGENSENLRPGYYEDLRDDYADNPDWVEMYIEGKPGILKKGKLVYYNFDRDAHVSKEDLEWLGGTLWRGWDNSGNRYACTIFEIAGRGVRQLREFFTEKMNMQDFAEYVDMKCNEYWPGAEWIDFSDPAGFQKYTAKGGGFTSNAQIMKEAGIQVMPSEQNMTARVNVVDSLLARRDGFLIDPSCNLTINGFLGGYHYPEIGLTGEYSSTVAQNKYKDVHDSIQYVLLKAFKSKKKTSKKTTKRRRRTKRLGD